MNLLKIFRNQVIWTAGLLLLLASPLQAEDKLPGDYRLMDEPEIHTKGKVVLLEFADFYCPHCHMFESEVVTQLKKEFGDRLEVRMVGFPVMRGKLPTAFEMYEQAKSMGRGSEMKSVLFRTIHKDKIHIFDRSLRALLIREVGLNVKDFETGMSSGEPYKELEQGKKWGERIGVTHTPTIVLNGNIRVDKIDIENLRTLIIGILKQDQAG
ncbi:DsbA family protein [Candidatus Nitronereus thalassa]|uniref:Thioredoxin domain-containing protein n=1 Tax=Candidatus Nitronereus thalassa TaxID=3020898 RepID=A0ABU3K5U7_9BACT|nr:DsbA family protein [Candidatus Nitronereus thalassa]MDT7041792.1 thioredoxin domain-containing protein [Candidatus Nitronereus thalassa]